MTYSLLSTPDIEYNSRTKTIVETRKRYTENAKTMGVSHFSSLHIRIFHDFNNWLNFSFFLFSILLYVLFIMWTLLSCAHTFYFASSTYMYNRNVSQHKFTSWYYVSQINNLKISSSENCLLKLILCLILFIITGTKVTSIAFYN